MIFTDFDALETVNTILINQEKLSLTALHFTWVSLKNNIHVDTEEREFAKYLLDVILETTSECDGWNWNVRYTFQTVPQWLAHCAATLHVRGWPPDLEKVH